MTIIQAMKSKATPVVAIVLLWTLSSGVLGLALPLYLSSAGVAPREWGLLAGASAFAMVFAEPAWGWLSDRLGIAAPLALSLSAAAVLTPIFLFTSRVPVLMITQLIRGVALVAVAPVCRRALANALGPGRQATGLGLFQACATLGGGVGSLLGGYLIGPWGYVPAFALAAALPLLSLALTLANRKALGTLHGPAPSPSDAAEAVPAVDDGRPGGTILRFAGLALIAMCIFAGNSAARSFLPILGAAQLKLDAAQVGVLLTLTSLLSGLLMVGVGRLSDRIGRRPLILAGLILLSASLVAYAYAASFVALVAIGLVFSLAVAAAVPSALAMASDSAPAGRQGQAIGLYGACEDVGLMVGPVVCGFLWDGYGPQVAFTACAAIVALGAAVALVVREARPTRERRANPASSGVATRCG